MPSSVGVRPPRGDPRGDRILFRKASPLSLAFWSNWKVWKKALLYTAPFAVVVILLFYYYVNYYSKPVYNFPEALWWGDVSRVQYFVESEGVDIESFVDNEKRTALLFSAFGNQTDVVKYLIERGANINAIDANGLNALHYASLKMNPFMVDFLVTVGLDVNGADRNGRTPLHIAAINGDVTTAAVLIYNGEATPYVKDSHGMLPLEYARHFHGGAKSNIALQISGGREKAEETLFYRHLPRRTEKGEEDDIEVSMEFSGGLQMLGRRRVPKKEKVMDDPEVRAKQRIHRREGEREWGEGVDDEDDDELPIVRPLKKTNRVSNEIPSANSDSMGSFSAKPVEPNIGTNSKINTEDVVEDEDDDL